MSVKFTLDQPSFAAGELAPAMYGRTDLAKYKAGCKTLRNFFALATGGAANRTGTTFIGRCKSQVLATPCQLIPFTFSTLQTYMLEFGEQYMRVIAGIGGAPAGYVLEPSFNISAITQANPGVITAAGHNFVNNDWVQVNSVGGMTQINSFQGAQPYAYIVQNVAGNNFTLTDLDGNAVNTTNFSAYTSGGTVARIFTLATPYHLADLPLLKWTQKFDVMTLVHPSYAPRQLTRTQHWVWTLTTITFAALVQAPTAPVATAQNFVGANPNVGYAYVITSVTDSPFEESVPTVAATCTNNGLNQDTTIYNSITWTAPASGPTPSRYNIYKGSRQSGAGAAPTIFGYIGQSTSTGFTDANVAPDFTRTPPTHQNPFAANNNPGCDAYYQGRLFFAASSAQPENLWSSKTGDFSNMDFASPTQPNDAITVALDSNQANPIKHLVSLNALLALTASGAWQITGGQGPGSPIDPATITAQPQAYIGCSDIRPIPINYDVLYVQAKQSRVRDLSYNFYVNIYTGDDKSILSEHLVVGRMIQRWAYAEEPYKVIWAVRDDGVALGFTFLKEQDVYAWSRHDTNGLYESVGTVTEGQEDAVYWVVTRIIPGANSGNPVQYVERTHTRNLGSNLALNIPAMPELGWFVDCGLGYGPTVMTGANLFPGVGACFGGSIVNGVFQPQTGVVFSADAAIFTAGMVGNVIRANGGIATITGFTDSQHVVCTITPWAPFAPFPNDPNTTSSPQVLANAVPLPALSGNWSSTKPVSSVSGLAHLNGMTVTTLADGNVQPLATVQAGVVNLPQGVTATIIAIGLPYTAQLQTLNLEIEPSVKGKRKFIPAVTLTLQDSRGLKVQCMKDPGIDTANMPPLIEIKERFASQFYGQPIPLRTGIEYTHPMPLWSSQGAILLQQDNPLPCTVLSISPSVVVGDDPG